MTDTPRRAHNIDPEVAHQRAVLAANARWSREPDRTAATQKMRDGLRAKWGREVDAEVGEVDEATREQLIESKQREHLARMNLARALKKAKGTA